MTGPLVFIGMVARQVDSTPGLFAQAVTMGTYLYACPACHVVLADVNGEAPPHACQVAP